MLDASYIHWMERLSCVVGGDARFTPDNSRSCARQFNWVKMIDTALPWDGGAGSEAQSSVTLVGL